MQSPRKLFQVCRTFCPAGLRCSAGHFYPPADIFVSWWLTILVSLAGHFPCRTKCLAPSALEEQIWFRNATNGHLWFAWIWHGLERFCFQIQSNHYRLFVAFLNQICSSSAEPSAGHQQKSAGLVWHVRHISRGLEKTAGPIFLPRCNKFQKGDIGLCQLSAKSENNSLNICVKMRKTNN